MAMINEDECPKGLPGWLATFGDLMSLLLTFFVLLLSFSSMEEVKFNHAMGSLRGSLGVFQSEPEMSQPIRVSMPLVRGSVRQSNNIRKAAEALEKSLSDEGLEGDVSLEGTASGLVIRIQAPVVYDSGSAALREEIQTIFYRIGDLLQQLPNEVVVQGHTDDTPISSAFPSNWELSFQRAVNAARFFITECGIHPRRIATEGFGEYRPLVPNTTEENRRKNRRIEIHILYAGETDGNLKIISDAFKNFGMEGQRDDGAPIYQPRRGRGR
ncbi:MAG: flagellar motor protein MotB [bacterium]|nr:flagellar motor protein MotB [bacterium]